MHLVFCLRLGRHVGLKSGFHGFKTVVVKMLIPDDADGERRRLFSPCEDSRFVYMLVKVMMILGRKSMASFESVVSLSG